MKVGREVRVKIEGGETGQKNEPNQCCTHFCQMQLVFSPVFSGSQDDFASF